MTTSGPQIARTDPAGSKAPPRNPVIIGGLGGSGTRVVAQFLQLHGYHIGENLNSACDSMDFEPLFKPHIPRVLKATKSANFAYEDLPSDVTRGLAGDFEKCLNLFTTRPGYSYGQPTGWKNPRSLYLWPAYDAFLDTPRFILTIRDGRDMTLSRNTRQFRKYSDLVLGRRWFWSRTRKMLEFWARINSETVDWCKSVLPDRFLVVRYEDACTDPDRELERIGRFVGSDRHCLTQDIVRPTVNIGRYKDSDAARIDSANIRAALARFGYTDRQ